MTLKEDVERFLNEFKVKMEVFDIVFVDRNESKMSMLSLGLTYLAAKEVIRSLEVDDYSEGPLRYCISFHRSEIPMEYPLKI